MRIADMNVSARVKSCLMEAGYTDLDDIFGMTDEDLMEITNLDQWGVDEIRAALNEENDREEEFSQIEDDGDYDISEDQKVEITTSNLEMLKRRFALVMTTLTEREQTILTIRYGLDGGRTHSLREVGKMLGFTGERIRQIEAKCIRKLRYPSRFRMLKEYLSEGADSIDVLRLLSGQDLTSVEIDEGDAALSLSIDVSSRFIKERTVSSDTPIEKLDLSNRSFNYLKSAGINCVGDLCNRTYEDMAMVMNMGRRSLEEVLAKLIELGLSLREGSETGTKNNQLEGNESIGDDRLNTPIYKLNLTTESYNYLQGAGIDTERDLCMRSYNEMRNINGLGRTGLNEVLAKMAEIGLSLRNPEEEMFLYGYPEDVKDIAREKGEYWENRLYIEMMILNYRWLLDFRKLDPVMWKVKYDHDMISSDPKFKDFMHDKLLDILGYFKEMSDAVNKKAAEAVGVRGEPGNVDKIISAVQEFMEIYRKWIRWKLEFEKVTAFSEYHYVIEALLSVADSVLSGVDELYNKLLSAKKTYDDYLDGKISLDGVEIDLSVSFKPFRFVLVN